MFHKILMLGSTCLFMSACNANWTQAAGTKGKRCAMPNTRIMMHQPAGGAMGSADEVNIQAAELNRTMKVRIRALRTKQTSPLKCICHRLRSGPVV